MAKDRASAWRKLEDPAWEQVRRALDWMSAPGMHDYVGRFFPEGQGWVAYAKRRVLEPLCQLPEVARSGGIRLLSLGCGNGSVDAACMDMGWPVHEYHVAEFDDQLLSAAAARLRTQGRAEIVAAHRLDFDALALLDVGRFDAIFFCHSLHHCTDIEGLIDFLRRSLLPHGIVFGADYFGGARLQPDFEILPLLRMLYGALPDCVKINLATGEPEPEYRPPSLRAVMEHDPSEAPRSGDLRSVFLSQFRELETIPMGGTLLRPLLAMRAGSFLDADETISSVLRLLCVFEAELISSGRIRSDDLFFHGRL